MSEVWCYAFAEDVLSCTVMERLVDFCNETSRKVPLRFYKGFPENKCGFGNLKKLIPSICDMARANIRTFILTDLDLKECAPELIRQWFGVCDNCPAVPANVLFRVAERAVEAWLLADAEGIAEFLDIAKNNFAALPDSLRDPKEYLLNIIRSKGRKRFHKEMLPKMNAHIGPEYNPRLCEFVRKHWDVERAVASSASLQRTIAAINQF